MKDIKKIEAEIKNNNTKLQIEEYIRYIEYKTVTKIDIQLNGCGYRISVSRWYSSNDCEFKFLFESHKFELKDALCELAIKISDDDYKIGCE